MFKVKAVIVTVTAQGTKKRIFLIFWVEAILRHPCLESCASSVGRSCLAALCLNTFTIIYLALKVNALEQQAELADLKRQLDGATVQGRRQEQRLRQHRTSLRELIRQLEEVEERVEGATGLVHLRILTNRDSRDAKVQRRVDTVSKSIHRSAEAVELQERRAQQLDQLANSCALKRVTLRAALNTFLKDGFKIQVIRKDETIPGVKLFQEVGDQDLAVKSWKRLGVAIDGADLKSDTPVPPPLTDEWIAHLVENVEAKNNGGSISDPGEIYRGMVFFMAARARRIRGQEVESFITEKEIAKLERAIHGTETDSGYYTESMAVVQAMIGVKRSNLKQEDADYGKGLLYLSGVLQTDSMLLMMSAEKNDDNPIDSMTEDEMKVVKDTGTALGLANESHLASKVTTIMRALGERKGSRFAKEHQKFLKEGRVANYPFGNPASNLRISKDETAEDFRERMRFLTAMAALISQPSMNRKLAEGYVSTVRRSMASDRVFFTDLASSPETVSMSHDLLKAMLQDQTSLTGGQATTGPSRVRTMIRPVAVPAVLQAFELSPHHDAAIARAAIAAAADGLPAGAHVHLPWALTRAIRAATELEPSLCILSVDGVGAYDHVSRHAILQGLQDDAGLQPLLPFVRQFYSTPSEYAVLAYLDDVYLLCPPARTRPLYEELQQALRRHSNVSLNHGKTRIWNADGTPLPGWPPPVPNAPPIWVGDRALPLEQQGVVVLGAPIGTLPALHQHWPPVADRIAQLLTGESRARPVSVTEATRAAAHLRRVGCRLVVIALETGGRWGQEAVDFIRGASAALVHGSPDAKNSQTSRLDMKIDDKLEELERRLWQATQDFDRRLVEEAVLGCWAFAILGF
eukprot:s881_g4.t1